MGRFGTDPALDTLIACGPRAPADARRAVTGPRAALPSALLRDVQLLVSEVVTNSVRHSGSDHPIRLRLWSHREGVRVEIDDGGRGFEAAAPRAADGPGGRGLLILEAIADRWGVGDPVGRVGFELMRAREPARAG